MTQNTTTVPHLSKSAKLGYKNQSKPIPMIEKLQNIPRKPNFSWEQKRETFPYKMNEIFSLRKAPCVTITSQQL
jgi:hypothetical protein